MNPPEIIDAAKCPLCGDDNNCANICDDKNPDKNCWCKNLKFPQQLLDAVPFNAKNKICICQHCLNKSVGA